MSEVTLGGYRAKHERAAAFTGGRQVGAANFGEFTADVPPPATKNAGAAKKG